MSVKMVKRWCFSFCVFGFRSRLLGRELESGEAEGAGQTHGGVVFGAGEKLPSVSGLHRAFVVGSFHYFLVSAFLSGRDRDEKLRAFRSDGCCGIFHFVFLVG